MCSWCLAALLPSPPTWALPRTPTLQFSPMALRYRGSRWRFSGSLGWPSHACLMAGAGIATSRSPLRPRAVVQPRQVTLGQPLPVMGFRALRSQRRSGLPSIDRGGGGGVQGRTRRPMCTSPRPVGPGSIHVPHLCSSCHPHLGCAPSCPQPIQVLPPFQARSRPMSPRGPPWLIYAHCASAAASALPGLHRPACWT